MALDRANADHQLVRDLCIGVSCRDDSENLDFAIRKVDLRVLRAGVNALCGARLSPREVEDLRTNGLYDVPEFGFRRGGKPVIAG